VRDVHGTWVFVTSEQPPHGKRAYSVRVMDGEGEISTAGPFCEFTSSVANRVAEQLARKGRSLLPDGNFVLLRNKIGTERNVIEI